MNDGLRIIVSGGGTGGHIFPAISIANALKAQHPEAEILFVGAEGRFSGPWRGGALCHGYSAEQKAEGIKLVGEAEAEAIKAKGIAEAEGIDKKAEALVAESKADKKKLEELSAKAATGKLDDVMKNKVEGSGVEVVAGQVDGLAVNDLRTLCDSIRDKMDTGVVVTQYAYNGVEDIVKVEKVTTANILGKVKRMGATSGKRADWKKAIVKLTEDSKTIEFFDSLA